MSISVVNTLPEDEWRQFVEKHPAGNIFHTPEMFQVFSQTKGFRPELWAAAKGSRILALLLPVQITLMNGLLRRFTTRSVVYGSVLCVPNADGEEALSQLLQTYKRETDGASLFTELRNLSSLGAVQPILRKHGFAYEDYLDYLIDLNRSPEAIFESFGRRTRKNIRRGLRQGAVVVEEAKEQEQVNACYDLVSQSYREAHVPVAQRSLFKAAFDLLHPKGMVRFTLARVDQTPVASSVELLYKDVIYGWFGGVDRNYSSYVPNELVMWDILKWGAENGYRVYDFGGAGKPDEEYGVRDFKSKFGGELVCFGRNTRVHAPLFLYLSKVGYRVLRPLL
jgi:serine/alanine adding enzyme